MTEEYPINFEANIFFSEYGDICMGGGLHIKLCGPGTPTVSTIEALIERVKAIGVNRMVADGQLGPAQQPSQVAPEAQEMPSKAGEIPGLPHCPRVGVWASAKGRWPEGFKADWKHNDPQMNKQGAFFCPTPIGKDKATGQLLWCTWRARELEDGTYEEYEVTSTKP